MTRRASAARPDRTQVRPAAKPVSSRSRPSLRLIMELPPDAERASPRAEEPAPARPAVRVYAPVKLLPAFDALGEIVLALVAARHGG